MTHRIGKQPRRKAHAQKRSNDNFGDFQRTEMMNMKDEKSRTSNHGYSPGKTENDDTRNDE